MDSLDIDQYTKLYSFDELANINDELDKIDKGLQTQTNVMEKPDSIVQRVFVDFFGIITLYGLLFLMCDATQAIVNDTPLFGFEWLFFGPYYFFTKAPLLTRIWKSKKFLEDLSELNNAGIEWDPKQSCSMQGGTYTEACDREEDDHHNQPVRDKLGKGLDWFLRHTIGKHFGGILGNGDCYDQGITIAYECADQRATSAYNAYTFFCEQQGPVAIVATPDQPNAPGNFSQQTNGWDDRSKEAYQAYYDVYTAIYLIGSTNVGQHGRPDNLNPAFDATNNYCFNARTLYSIATTNSKGFGQPPWWVAANGQHQGPCYYQDNYTDHLFDYWDPIS